MGDSNLDECQKIIRQYNHNIYDMFSKIGLARGPFMLNFRDGGYALKTDSKGNIAQLNEGLFDKLQSLRYSKTQLPNYFINPLEQTIIFNDLELFQKLLGDQNVEDMFNEIRNEYFNYYDENNKKSILPSDNPLKVAFNFSSAMKEIIPKHINLSSAKSQLAKFYIKPELQFQAPMIYSFLLHQSKFKFAKLVKFIDSYNDEVQNDELNEFFEFLGKEATEYDINTYFHENGSKTNWCNGVVHMYMTYHHNQFVADIEKHLKSVPSVVTQNTDNLEDYLINTDNLNMIVEKVIGSCNQDFVKAEELFNSIISTMRFSYILYSNGPCLQEHDPALPIHLMMREKYPTIKLTAAQESSISLNILETQNALGAKYLIERIMYSILSKGTKLDSTSAFDEILEEHSNVIVDGDKQQVCTDMEMQTLPFLKRIPDLKFGNLVPLYKFINASDDYIVLRRNYNYFYMKFMDAIQQKDFPNTISKFSTYKNDVSYNDPLSVIKYCLKLITEGGCSINNPIYKNYFIPGIPEDQRNSIPVIAKSIAKDILYEFLPLIY